MYSMADSHKKLIVFVGFIMLTCSLFAQKGNFPFYEFAGIYNFGDIIPKDQGGKFVQVELLNTENDAIIVHKIRNGLLYEKFGNPIDWERYEKTELETSVWINRLYFLPSFARMYYITKDKSYLTDMMSILNTWIKDNPRVPGSEKRTFNWRDMQVAWRSIHLSWCYYLAKDGLSSEDKTTIENIQKEHAAVLLSWFAAQPLNDFNHQSHGALAMLYLSCLFPNLDTDGKLEINAIRILTHHMISAHYKDGGNIEQMFGYFPFQTSIFRDMFLLCKANNIKYPSGLVPLLHKMLSYMSALAQPDETMPPVNDSYEMSIIPSVAILNSILKTDVSTKSAVSAFYPDTQIAVMRSGKVEEKSNWYILLNPAIRIGSHAHAGRLGVYLWYNNKPVLIDAGCSNYDKPIKNRWYRTSMAHNTVLIDGTQDAESSSDAEYAKKRDTENRITDWADKENYKYCRMVSPHSDPTNCNVTWARSIALIKDEFAVIYDCFTTKDKHSYEVLFHTPPVEVLPNSDDKSVRIKGDSSISLIPVKSDALISINVTNEYFYLNGSDYKAPMINYTYKSGGNLNAVTIVFPESGDISRLKIEKTESDQGLGLLIDTGKGDKKILLFKSNDAKEIRMYGERTGQTFELFEKR
ncbi:MAG: alginate lyase family protein [Bacteroidales bacterium]|jgi:hypothetical protein